MDIDQIRQNIKKGFYDISRHAEEERRNDALEMADIKAALLKGKIIEEYPNDPRGPSCLVLGYAGETPVHMVCGEYSSGKTLIITVYKPDPLLWDEHFEKRRGEK